ncbi:GNAT family N-acetyltransferase [Streptosporangium sp. 'caverna']|uniref:GNAT family N-acetyltransferase n=1 Tax=Streptosporangium sp. 'caverna' TaxID=2202249 RepID=UPI000D7E009B|nr:GNAT family N-acetyltransferase [Streptosporangium sp. 'caverna']AWS47227.1 GNAT family N-acetyltransferase [Streptosporangium sp. 'caverna']
MEKPTGIRVRNGRLEDVGALLAFWLEAAEGTDRRDDPAKVVALIERDPEAVLIAEIDGEMAGTLIAGWDGWRAHLYRLAVDPARRRQGIGSVLIRAAEERFAKLGAFRADAMVLHENVLAHHAWESAGYAPQPQWARWVKPLS